MKKYFYLLGLTFTLILLTVIIQKNYENSLTKVSSIVSHIETVEENISASGNIEEIGQESIKLDMPVMVSDVNVEIGDSVKAGELLLKIDKDQTVEAFSNAAVNSNEFYSIIQPENNINQVPSEIYAPVNGVVTAVNAKAGELSDGYNPLITISDTSKLIAKVNISELCISNVKIGQDVVITGSAFKGTKIKGKVSKIFPFAKQIYSETSKQTVVEAIIDLEKTDKNLKPGYSVVANIVVDKRQSIVLPYEAISQDSEGNEFVYIIKGKKAVKQQISSGLELEKGIEIVSGIKEGDEIVINPSRLKNKNNVKVVR